MAFKFEGKQSIPSWFWKCCQFTPKW